MSNDQQEELLYSGVEVWNAWRNANSSEVVDLSGADLRRLNLRGANLSAAQFIGAKLRGVLFSGAKLDEVDFGGADLKGANFRGCVLFGADLRCADLTGADFRKAGMNGVNVSSALLKSNADQLPRIVATNLAHVRGLSQQQLDSMMGDRFTQIPDNLTRPLHWLENDDEPRVLDISAHSEEDSEMKFAEGAAQDQHPSADDVRSRVERNPTQFLLLAVAILEEIDSEIIRIRSKNYEDEFQDRERDRQLEFLIKVKSLLSREFDPDQSETGEQDVAGRWSRLFHEYVDEVHHFLSESRPEIVSGGIRLSLISVICALAGQAGYVLPAAAVILFGGSALKKGYDIISKLKP